MHFSLRFLGSEQIESPPSNRSPGYGPYETIEARASIREITVILPAHASKGLPHPTPYYTKGLHVMRIYEGKCATAKDATLRTTTFYSSQILEPQEYSCFIEGVRGIKFTSQHNEMNSTQLFVQTNSQSKNNSHS